MSDVILAVLLGLIEGLTEFIPVSSTGHLIISGDALSFSGPRAETFEVFIQLGAILAVVVLYPGRFTGLLKLSSDRSFDGRDGLIKLAVACAPAFICGALIYETIKGVLWHPVPVAIALIFGGIVMVGVEKKHKQAQTESVDAMTLWQCFGVGLFQCFALWPGISRSGSTIIGAMLLGCNRVAAAEFSFLVAVPVMFAAVGYDLLKSAGHLGVADIPLFSIGFFISFITAVIAIRFFMGVISKYSLVPFGVYRVLLGIVVLTIQLV